jgi:hypothetical protein
MPKSSNENDLEGSLGGTKSVKAYGMRKQKNLESNGKEKTK